MTNTRSQKAMGAIRSDGNRTRQIVVERRVGNGITIKARPQQMARNPP